MTKDEIAYFKQNYPIVYEAGEKDKKPFLNKTRLIEHHDSFVMETEVQAKLILKDKLELDHFERKRVLNHKIENSKRNKLKNIVYELLPFLQKRFYHECHLKLECNEFKKKKVNIENLETNQRNIDLTSYSFKNLKLNNSFYIYVPSIMIDKKNKRKVIIEELKVNKVFYIIDEKNKKIRVGFYIKRENEIEKRLVIENEKGILHFEDHKNDQVFLSYNEAKKKIKKKNKGLILKDKKSNTLCLNNF